MDRRVGHRLGSAKGALRQRNEEVLETSKASYTAYLIEDHEEELALVGYEFTRERAYTAVCSAESSGLRNNASFEKIAAETASKRAVIYTRDGHDVRELHLVFCEKALGLFQKFELGAGCNAVDPEAA